VLTVLCVTSVSQTLAQEQPPNGSAGQKAAPLPPDLTPSGYLPSDPLFNDGEVKMGREAAAEIAKTAKFCQDKALVARVDAIGAKIAAIADTTQVHAGFGNDKVVKYHYTYHVIDNKEVNAFSLPGGFIYVYKGMLDLISTDDELAAVLGHETAHAAHHHVSTLDHEANKMSNAMLLGVLAAIVGHVNPGDIAGLYTGASYGIQGELNNVFSDAAERDADHTGMIYMQKAGYNPVGMLTMLARLGQQEKESPDIDMGFLRDHPLTPDRIAAAKDELASLGVAVNAETIRSADDALPTNTVTITVGGKPVITLAAADRASAEEAATRLDKELATLQMYEVKSDGPNLIVRGDTLLTFTDADAAVQSPPNTPDLAAANAMHALKLVLWQQEVTGIQP
jgi:antitoxin (DNA-binding transcriptional repressor) of toxin-antitoxin stability system